MGLLRLLFFVLVGCLAYLFLRTIFNSGQGKQRGRGRAAGQQDSSRLEEDPVCGVYVSRETAVRRNIGGREIFFCGEQCADKYISDSGKNST